jgi:Fur family ferric uptake transcriptional regulator
MNCGLCPNLDIVHPVHSDLGQTLKDHGLSVTAQRLEIYRAVSSHPHATADDILDAARSSLGTISRQSVYDTLNTFAEKGLLRRIQPIGSPALYEDRVNDNHHHLICRNCGIVVDVDCAVGYRPCLHASNDNNFEIDEAEVVYWGNCPACTASTTKTTTPKTTTKTTRSKK